MCRFERYKVTVRSAPLAPITAIGGYRLHAWIAAGAPEILTIKDLHYLLPVSVVFRSTQSV